MRNKSFTIVCILLIVTLIALIGQVKSTSTMKKVKICIKNCGQCKRMYGDYFEGRICADACLHKKGRVIPDCYDLYSIRDFLSKLE